MADWTKPSVTDAYANFLKLINAKLSDVATQFSLAAPTNAPDGSIRWNPTTTRWEQYAAATQQWSILAVNGVAFPSITLASDPSQPMQAATKQYADSLKTLITAAQNIASAALPKTGGTLTGNIGINNNATGVTTTFSMDGPKATNRATAVYTNSVLRWYYGVDASAENGSNSGSTYFVNRYSDSGAYIDTPFSILRTTGQASFSTRPTWGGVTPWDSGNLPNPLSANGGQISNGDLTLWQTAGGAGGDAARLVMINAITGLSWRARLNGSTQALEFINTSYNAVNAQFFDSGNMWIRGSITGVGDVHINGTLWNSNAWVVDLNGAARINYALGDVLYLRGAGGSANYSVGMMRNDGAWMGICHGNGDFYYAAQGWLSGLMNGKATAGVWHHGATVANCGSGTSISVGASGNTLTMTLTNTNCNCNCANCSCFIEGTPVMMADGSYKAVEDVRIGDLLMGTEGPAEVWDYEYPQLGSRRLMRFEGDNSLGWSEEHPCWTLRDGEQWWWNSGKQAYLDEVEANRAAGLLDNQSMRTGGDDAVVVAHIEEPEGWRTARVVHVEGASPDTQLYFPKTRKSQTLILGSGWLFSGGMNEFTYDYHRIDWNRDRHTILEARDACVS